jgi:uncharacterized protein
MNETSNPLRVFVDSNILISAILSGTSTAAQVLKIIIEEHQLILCSYSLTEVSRVIDRKFPRLMAKWDTFLTALEFELAYTPSDLTTIRTPHIRDPKDLPILVSAVIAQPDMLIAGDQDFHTPEIKDLVQVCTPAEFLLRFRSTH